MDAKVPSGADDLSHTLLRIAEALERLSPRVPAAPDLAAADAFVWHPDGRRLMPVPKVNRVEMGLLRGVDRVRDVLMDNTERFARGLPANNALLWGARGMGKSSLVKASHASVNAAHARDKGWRPLISTPPMRSSGIRTDAALFPSRRSTGSTCRCCAASTVCATC